MIQLLFKIKSNVDISFLVAGGKNCTNLMPASDL